MEKKLQQKFISITMTVVFIILFLIVLVLNIINYSNIDNKANSVINIMQENNGILPEELNQELYIYGESAYATRYFTVTFTEDNIIVDISNFRSVTIEDAVEISTSLTNDEGIYNDYKYKMFVVDGNVMIVFIDCSSEILTFKTTLVASIYIGLIALLGVFVLSVIFSRKAVKPFIANNENQKKFITDISHELKTPLAIIKADTEVLEMQYGECDWTADIQNQVSGLNNLVSYLIRLSKMEENEEIEKERINLSEVLIESCENISVLSSYKIKKTISDNVFFTCDTMLFKMMISILLENAVKYTSGEIQVILTKKYMIFTNRSENLEIGNYEKWFDRFYKADQSRTSTGSFGIGLSMARRIAEKHDCTISAYSEDGENITLKIKL